MTTKHYLERIKELGIVPNFFISETYLSQPDIKAKQYEDWIWLEEKGVVLFPALPLGNTAFWNDRPVNSFWASFPNMEKREGYKLLDYNYFYKPSDFVNLYGGEWQTFRKNIKKFPRREPGWEYTIRRDETQVRKLLVKWLEDREETVYDPEFIITCILNPRKKDYIKYLYNGSGELVSINYADENWSFINYRFLICNRYPFADEFSRYKFFTDPSVILSGKLVNDGGSLGSETLQKFKLKLNPKLVKPIYSFNIL